MYRILSYIVSGVSHRSVDSEAIQYAAGRGRFFIRHSAERQVSMGERAKKKILVVVESPSKAKTIGKMLGSRYKIVPSVGHVRDLPKSRLGINIENNFEPDYINIRGKGDVIKTLRKEAKSASRVLLATDPDREGEAISWHIAYILGLDINEPCRIEFHEITKTAVKNAVKNPRKLNLNVVDAQQARRVLDRLVGYQISPLLWRKIRRGISAGRVQSAALKILCDREQQIQDFVPEEYWTITADFTKSRKRFQGILTEYNGRKIEMTSGEEARRILQTVRDGTYTVVKVESREKRKKPSPPFTTSTLQQQASSQLNFNSRKTMQIAQQLYEGVNIKGRGTSGLVTYIRTDSVRISEEADRIVKKLISDDYGSQYLGTNEYVNRKKDIQDAHEAIRPSDPLLRPEDIKDSLSKDQYRLYDLIWRRFTASRMAQAVYDSMTVDVDNKGYLFHCTGSKMKFDGFTRVSGQSAEDKKRDPFPPLENGETLSLAKPPASEETNPYAEQHFTQPPARFTEASLIKYLEEKGIGRPSTYAPIVATLTERRYVKKEKKSLVPQDLGMQVSRLMDDYFGNIVDAGFTAQMESNLDSIEEDGTDWKAVVSDFYTDFEKDLKIAEESIEKTVVQDEPIGRDCPECGRPLVLKHGRFGEFIACSGYPECKYTDRVKYPVGVACPKCGKDIVRLKSRKGKIFYGCEGFPSCDVRFWNKPVNRQCPECGSLMTEKAGKKPSLICSNDECKHTEILSDDEK